jgi:Uma2 family endonuclease
MILKQRASIDDLRGVPDGGKAELVDGKVKLMSPTGGRPARAGGRIYANLLRHEEEHGGGYALPDNAGFIVDLPNRQSFSPDAAWYTGQSIDMSFLNGAPAFAVEVRSEGDYGPAAEREIAAKIADYFAAGTLVVWDVDLLHPDVIRKYTPQHPSEPTIFKAGDIADAEPAVPGWRMKADVLR